MTLKPFRRIVTGHDEAGRAIIQSDAPPTRSSAEAGQPSTKSGIRGRRRLSSIVTARSPPKRS